ncbi:MAG: sulfatase-like hydrolase/transferase [Acidobacteriia bacterium]|nr:sulfatase-like hydrolase/transferase [Terriglobia bacterium]
MNRRQFISSAAAAPALAAAQSRRPNFIVIMTDDQGLHDLGCLGATDLKTPHIDALAASGARFTNWYSNAPVCAPSRAALMTGRYPIRAGVPTNGQPLTAQQRTTASLLKPLNYRTGLVGKWHLGDTPDTVPNAHGFDYFYGFHPGCVDFYSHIYYWGDRGNNPQVNFHSLFRNRQEIFEDGEYLTERITTEAASFIGRHHADPFFLTVTYNAPHYPMHAPEKYKRRFPMLRQERQTYAAMLAAVDDGVGQIRAAISQHGLTNDTLIFYVADNGATTENRAGIGQQPATAGDNSPFRGFKFSLFDGGMHVPGIMSWPGVIPGGQVNSELAMTMDILPTITKAAGGTISHTVDGKDILPVAHAGAKSPHDAIFWKNGNQLAVRRGDWKLVLNGITYGRTPEEKKPLTGDDAVFLSNLPADPGETRNLRHANAALVDELSSLIHKWSEDMRP